MTPKINASTPRNAITHQFCASIWLLALSPVTPKKPAVNVSF
jgi:hypothetical protein